MKGIPKQNQHSYKKKERKRSGNKKKYCSLLNTHIGGQNGFPCSRSQLPAHMRPAMRSHAAKTRTSNSRLSMKNHWVTFPQVPKQAGQLNLPTLPLDERIKQRPLTSSANCRRSPARLAGAFRLSSGRPRATRGSSFSSYCPQEWHTTPLPWTFGVLALGAPGEMPEVRGSQNHRTLRPHALCMATKVARVTEPVGWDTVAAPKNPLGEGGPDVLAFPEEAEAWLALLGCAALTGTRLGLRALTDSPTPSLGSRGITVAM